MAHRAGGTNGGSLHRKHGGRDGHSAPGLVQHHLRTRARRRLAICRLDAALTSPPEHPLARPGCHLVGSRSGHCAGRDGAGDGLRLGLTSKRWRHSDAHDPARGKCPVGHSAGNSPRGAADRPFHRGRGATYDIRHPAGGGPRGQRSNHHDFYLAAATSSASATLPAATSSASATLPAAAVYTAATLPAAAVYTAATLPAAAVYTAATLPAAAVYTADTLPATAASATLPAAAVYTADVSDHDGMGGTRLGWWKFAGPHRSI